MIRMQPAAIGIDEQTDVSSVIPAGWELAKVKDIIELNYGKGLKSDARAGGPVPVYGSNGLVGLHDRPLTGGPTIIVGRKGTVGAVHFSPQPCWPIDTTYYVDSFRGLDPQYLTLALRSLDLGHLDTSTAVPGLNRNDIYDQEILIPPLDEQRRIAAEVDRLVTAGEKCHQRLKRVGAILKRFRQSVLAAACSGRLTEDWRGRFVCSEPAATLMDRLLAARRRQPAQALRANPTSSTNVDSALYDRDAFETGDQALPDLPENWSWVPVGALAEKVVDGVHRKPDYVASGIPFVTVRNLTAGRGIDLVEVKYISDNDHKEFTRRANPERGDILVTKDGTLGVVRAVRTDLVFSIFVSVAMIKPISHDLTDYLEIALSSPQMQKQMVGVGSGLQHIHLRDLKVDRVPLPPLEEQREIVRRVHALFELADKVECCVSSAAVRADSLTQAILAKAFRGELVSTEAELAKQEGREYEPASVLLETLRADRISPGRSSGSAGRPGATKWQATQFRAPM